MSNVANECIPRYEPGQRITGKATGTITGCRLCSISGDLSTEGNISVALSGAGAAPAGATSHDAAIDGLVAVIGSGAVVPLDVAADVTAGDLLQAAANGKVTPAGNTDDTPATLTVGSGNAKVKVTAQEPGAAGNNLTLTIVDPGGTTASLSVDVDNGTDVIVSLARASSAITSTAADVIAAINEDNTASTLVVAANGASSTGASVVAAQAKTNLAGGADFAGEEGGRVIGQAFSSADFSDGDRAFVKLY